MSDNSPETKERILAAATELFAAEGLDGVSVRAIADKAGANVSLVSYYFGGKEGLYQTCLNEHARARMVSIKRILIKARSPEEVLLRIEMLAGEMIHSYFENPHVVKMMHREFERRGDFTCDVFKGTFLEIFHAMQRFFQDAIDDGFVRRSADPQLLCSVVMGSLSNALRMEDLSKRILNITLEDARFREKFIRHLSQLIGYGMLQTKEPTQGSGKS